MTLQHRVTPFLWFEKDCVQAAEFYVTVFKNSRVTSRNGMGCTFELDGQQVHALNGGPSYKLTPAFSFYVNCETQEEIDQYWNALLADGGVPNRCGWLVDRFGLSWQVIPSALPSLIGSPDEAKRKRAFEAMMTMQKIDLAALQKAHDGN